MWLLTRSYLYYYNKILWTSNPWITETYFLSVLVPAIMATDWMSGEGSCLVCRYHLTTGHQIIGVWRAPWSLFTPIMFITQNPIIALPLLLLLLLARLRFQLGTQIPSNFLIQNSRNSQNSVSSHFLEGSGITRRGYIIHLSSSSDWSDSKSAILNLLVSSPLGIKWIFHRDC